MMQENTTGKPINRLPDELAQYIRSTSSISTIAQCTEELVLNSLDAGSSCIAIRVDMTQLKVQVIDNGEGLSKKDLEKIGSRFMTSKCRTFNDLESGGLCKYGYRGESLANIRSMASILQIISKKKSEKDTWTVLFARGKRKPVKLFYENRQCCGTTITVVDFLYNLPVRKRMINSTLDLQDILQAVMAISLSNPSTSFTLKDEVSGEKMLQTSKQQSSKNLFVYIHGEEWRDKLLDIHLKSGKMTLQGFICKTGVRNPDNQYIYVNNRNIRSSRLNKIVINHLKKSIICRPSVSKDIKERRKYDNELEDLTKPAKLHPLFCIELEMPFFDFDISFGPRKNEIEFQNWDHISLFVNNALKEFLSSNNLLLPSERLMELNTKKDTNTYDKSKACQVLEQFSMSGIEPLEATCESESVFDANNVSSSHLPTQNELNNNDNKSNKNGNIIGTEELKGARQCLPVFKPKNNDLIIKSNQLSHLKLPVSSSKFPFSSTPNTSLYMNGKTKNISSFFRQTKDKYYIDEKGVFKKASVKNISKTINFKAMQQDIKNKGSFSVISPKNHSISRQIDRSNNFNENQRSHRKSESQRMESSHTLKSADLASDSIKEFSFNNFSYSPTRNKSMHLDCTQEPHGLLTDVTDCMVQMKTPVLNNLEIEKSSGYSSYHSIDCLSGIDVDGSISNGDVKSEKSDIYVSKENKDMIQSCKLSVYSRNSFDGWINDVDNVAPIYCDTHSNSSSLEIKHNNHENDLFATPHRSKPGNDIIWSHSNSCRIESDIDFMNCRSVETVPDSSCHNYTPINGYNAKYLKDDSIETKYIQESLLDWKMDNRDNEYDSCVSEVGLSFSDITEQNAMLNNTKLDILSEYSFAKKQDDMLINYSFNGDQCCTSAQPVHNTSLELDKTMPFQWLNENNSQGNETLHPFNLKEAEYAKPIHLVPSAKSIDSACISIIDNQVDEFCQDGQHIENEIGFEDNSCNGVRFKHGIDTSDQNSLSLSFPSIKGTKRNSGNISNVSSKRAETPEIGEDHNFYSSCIEVQDKQLISIPYQDTSDSEIKSTDTKTTVNAANFDLFENTVNKSNRVLQDSSNEWVIRTNKEGQTFKIHVPSGQITKEALDNNVREVSKLNNQTSNKDSTDIKSNAPKRELWPLPAGKSPFLCEKKVIASKRPKQDTFAVVIDDNPNDMLNISYEEKDELKWTKESLNSWYEERQTSSSAVDKLLSTWINPIFKYQREIHSISREARKISSISASPIRFQNDLFKKIRVLGQVDKKFISVICRKKQISLTEQSKPERSILLLFDQHAVHERIRLEKLTNDNFWEQNVVTSFKLETPMDLCWLSKEQKRIVHEYSDKFRTFGLEFCKSDLNEINDSNSKSSVNDCDQSLIVTHVPSCFSFKEENSKKYDALFMMKEITKNLICEIINTVKSTHGGGLAILPSTIGNLLNSKACRGAVKFGDSLSLNECESLINDLQNCNAPFQCAHGRPSIAPIIDIDDLKLRFKIPKKRIKLNLKQLGTI